MLDNKYLMSKTKFRKMVSLPDIQLTPEEADRFIDYIVDQSVLKGNARVVKMSRETKNIRALGLGSSRFLYPASTFSSSNYRKTFTENLIQLSSKKVRGCVVIYDDDLEDVFEGKAFADHIMKMVAAQIANELEDAFWIADTHGRSGFGSDDIRSLWDGWRYRFDNSQQSEQYYNKVTGGTVILDATNTVSARVANFDLTGGIVETATTEPFEQEIKFALMLKYFPSEYKQAGLNNLRFFCSDKVVSDYINGLSKRGTLLGDQAILGKGPIQFGGVPIVACPRMPTNLSVATDNNQKEKYGGGNYTDVLLTHKDNLIIGIQRDIHLEAQREAADEATYWFYSMRVDVAVENVRAAVLLKRLTTA